MTYVHPRCLRRGDRVAVVAPASPVDSLQLPEALALMRKHGLEPVLGDNVRCVRSRGIYAASHGERLAELVNAFEDDAIAGIIVATGGFGSARLLPDLPYDLIARKPKVLMGFSDVTALNAGLLARAGLVSFNGPTASIRTSPEDARQADAQSFEDALELLMSDVPWESRPFVRNRALPRCVRPGVVEGPAIGGNLTTLACLVGTPYLPDLTGAVLFLEDIDEGGYELARTLTHLTLAGVFDRVAGVVWGEFARTPSRVDPEDPTLEEAIVDFLGGSAGGGPACVYGYNFSHGDTGAVIPIGCRTVLDAAACSVTFDNPFAPPQ